MTKDGSFRSSASWLVLAVVLIAGAGAFWAFGPRPEPSRVTVQHILIAFAGSGTDAKRSKAEAEKLAGETLSQVRDGADFDKLLKALSDDRAGEGIYSMVNTDQTSQGLEYPRSGMVKAFGDLSFKLRVGGIGMAPFHPQDSPFGWHIIKRLK